MTEPTTPDDPTPDGPPLPRRSPWDPPPGADPGAVPSASGSFDTPASYGGGGIASPTPEPLRGVRGQRYGGPRFGGRGLLLAFGMLGILVTVAIMAFLSMQVLDGVGGSSSRGDADVSGALTQLPPTSAPTAPTTAVAGASPGGAVGGGAQVGPAGPVETARVARCAADRQTVATAAEAYQAMNGSAPPDVAALQAAGLVVSDHPLDVALQVDGATVTAVGTGPCAGR